MIVADRLQIPLEQVHFVAVRHRRGADRWRHRRVAFAAARRLRGAERGRRRARAGARGRGDDARGQPRRHRRDGRRRRRGRRAGERAHVGAARASTSRSRAVSDFEQDGATFPFGAHVAVVEVDLDTGRVTPIRHIAVDDCGRILNPLIVTGQQHGGIAQGIAQALWEQYVYDADGNPLTVDAHRLRDAERGRAAVVRGVEHRDAVAPQPARRQGHRRVGDDRLDARGAERGGRRAVATSACGTSTSRARRSGCGPRSATRRPGIRRRRGATRRAIFDNLTAPKSRADAEAVDI